MLKVALVGTTLGAAALATAPALAMPTSELGAALQTLMTETQKVAEVVPAPAVPPPASYAPAPVYVPPPPVVYYVPRPPPPPLVWYRPYWPSRPYWGWRRWWW